MKQRKKKEQRNSSKNTLVYPENKTKLSKASDSRIAYAKKIFGKFTGAGAADNKTQFTENSLKLKIRLHSAKGAVKHYWPITVDKRWTLNQIRFACSYSDNNEYIFQPFNFTAKQNTPVGLVKKAIVFAKKSQYLESPITLKLKNKKIINDSETKKRLTVADLIFAAKSEKSISNKTFQELGFSDYDSILITPTHFKTLWDNAIPINKDLLAAPSPKVYKPRFLTPVKIGALNFPCLSSAWKDPNDNLTKTFAQLRVESVQGKASAKHEKSKAREQVAEQLSEGGFIQVKNQSELPIDIKIIATRTQRKSKLAHLAKLLVVRQRFSDPLELPNSKQRGLVIPLEKNKSGDYSGAIEIIVKSKEAKEQRQLLRTKVGLGSALVASAWGAVVMSSLDGDIIADQNLAGDPSITEHGKTGGGLTGATVGALVATAPDVISGLKTEANKLEGTRIVTSYSEEISS